MRVALGCDHAGFPLKEELLPWLKELNIDFDDKGTYSADSVDYPDFAAAVAREVLNGNAELGMLICGSGNGMAMAANKFSEIRAALCWNPEIASLARQHNDANILVMPGRFLSLDEGKAIVHAFVHGVYEGGRHQKRIDKMKVLNR